MNRKQIAVLVILLGVLVLIATPTFLLSVYPPGWEMYNQIGALRHNDAVLDDEGDFTHPNERMGVYWKVDLDEENYYVPTIQVEMGDLRHVDFMGNELPASQPADSFVYERGNYSYYLDYHIYLYTVTIRTVADKERVGGGGIITPRFEHETSWPHEQWTPIFGDNGYNEKIGEQFSGGAYVKFIIDPWQGFTYRDPPEAEEGYRYDLEGCWAGVMNTYVFDRLMGQVDNQWGQSPTPDNEALFFIRGGLDRGNQVPMFTDDGSYGTIAPKVDWDPSITPDERIESTVVQYLPVQMLPGAKLHHKWDGTVDDIYPCDVYVMYTLRVDVLTSHGFVLHSAEQPPDPVPPGDFFAWCESFWDDVFTKLGMANPFNVFGEFSGFVAFLFTLVIGFIILLVLLAIFAPRRFVRLFRSAGQAKKAYKEEHP